jgi:hypothetical protein
MTEYVECTGDVYAPRGGNIGRCRSCGAEAATEDREAWLDAQVRSQAFRAYEIADAYRIPVNTIRSWAHRGRLLPHDHDAEDRPRYLVGDVLDLATADAVRRAEQQARRSRRKDSAA